MAAERIDQLGGAPNYDPEGLAMRSTTQYGGSVQLIEMIKEDLVAERIVIEHYNELIRFFGDKDVTRRRMLEHFLADEEDHATDMHDLLVAHQCVPSLENNGRSTALGLEAKRTAPFATLPFRCCLSFDN